MTRIRVLASGTWLPMERDISRECGGDCLLVRLGAVVLDAVVVVEDLVVE